jgi:ABC-type lipopolysaccharide export system ATPase subunit
MTLSTELIHIQNKEENKENAEAVEMQKLSEFSLEKPKSLNKSSTKSLSGYKRFLELQAALSTDLPKIDITYKNLNNHVTIKPNSVDNPSIAKSFKEMIDLKKKTVDYPILEGLTGQISHGKMTLVLAAGGAGKSTLLKTFGGLIDTKKHKITGELLYNGLSQEELLKENISVRKLVGYVDQQDTHLANLTVRETLQFAFKNKVLSMKRVEEFSGNKEVIELQNKSVDLILGLLRLEECADNIVGNSMIRGISGVSSTLLNGYCESVLVLF